MEGLYEVLVRSARDAVAAAEREERPAVELVAFEARLRDVVPGAVVFCAWCGKVGAGGVWVDASLLLAPDLQRRLQEVASHGICPGCFGRVSDEAEQQRQGPAPRNAAELRRARELRQRAAALSQESQAVRAPAAQVARHARSSTERPQLLFFYSDRSGPCRKAEAYLAQVLQRRHNHDTFRIARVSLERHPALAQRFAVVEVPAILVVYGGRVRARLNGPVGRRDIQSTLAPWLR